MSPLSFSGEMMMLLMVVQGGPRGDRPDLATSLRPVHGDSSRALHRVEGDPSANPVPAAFDTENALPNCMSFYYFNLYNKRRYVCLSVCLSVSMFRMAGQMAGPIETELDTRTHVHPGSVSVKVSVKVIHVYVRE